MIRRLEGLAAVCAGVALALAMASPGLAQTRTFVAYVGSYSAATIYSVNDMVSLGSDFYISLAADNLGNVPGSNSSAWALVGPGGGTVGATGAPGPMGPAGPAGPQGNYRGGGRDWIAGTGWAARSRRGRGTYGTCGARWSEWWLRRGG